MSKPDQRISIQTGYILVERAEGYDVVHADREAEFREFEACCAQAGCRKILILGPRTNVRLSSSETYELGKAIARLNLQIAIVERHDASEESMRFLQNVAENRGAFLRFFHDEREARDWLEIP